MKLIGDHFRATAHEAVALELREPLVAFTVTEWGTDAERANYARCIASAMAKASSLGISRVLVVPQVVRARESNSRTLAAIIEQAQKTAPGLMIEVMQQELTINELIATYRRCRLLVGSRMHSCVFARAAGTPFVAIAYDEGSKWSILSDFWPSHLIHGYSRLQEATLVRDVEDLLTAGAKTIQESEPRFVELIAAVDGNIPPAFGTLP